jgi:hypothetical protein
LRDPDDVYDGARALCAKLAEGLFLHRHVLIVGDAFARRERLAVLTPTYRQTRLGRSGHRGGHGRAVQPRSPIAFLTASASVAALNGFVSRKVPGAARSRSLFGTGRPELSYWRTLNYGTVLIEARYAGRMSANSIALFPGK